MVSHVDKDPFLTSEELAERWRTTRDDVLQLRHRGDAPRGHRIGRRVLFRLSDVEAFEAGRADPENDTRVPA
jgi:excisionase family DNA binding protein